MVCPFGAFRRSQITLKLRTSPQETSMKGHICEKPKGSGNWYAVIDVRDPATGKRRRKWHTLGASGKRQAQIECAKLISSIDGGTYMEPDKTTLAKYLERWME